MRESYIIEAVKAFAENAHAGQARKYADEPYVNHLFRVMEICRRYTSDLALLSAALLHDILEDTPVTREQLGEFLFSVMDQEHAGRTLGMVEALTDVFVKENYPSMNRRNRRLREAERLSMVGAEAQTIKYADIIDNVADLGDPSNDFAPVFMRECKDMLREMNRGDQRLHRHAVEIVDTRLKEYFRNANIRAL